MSEDDNDDAVGYGRPPRHTRFKKGQSGNPNGRKKANPPSVGKKLLEIVAEQAAEVVTVLDGGKRKQMPRIEAFVRSLSLKASTDPRMLNVYVALVTRAEREVPDKAMTTYDLTRLSEQELITFRDLLMKSAPDKIR